VKKDLFISKILLQYNNTGKHTNGG